MTYSKITKIKYKKVNIDILTELALYLVEIQEPDNTSCEFLIKFKDEISIKDNSSALFYGAFIFKYFPSHILFKYEKENGKSQYK